MTGLLWGGLEVSVTLKASFSSIYNTYKADCVLNQNRLNENTEN